MHLLHLSLRRRDDYLAKALTQAGHVVETAPDEAEALLLCADTAFDAVVLEVQDLAHAPLRHLSEAVSPAALALVLDQATTAERTRSLREGADACFVRPVHFREFEARLSALVRLTPRHAPENPISVGKPVLVLDPASRTARLADRSLILTGGEYRLLDYLATHAGEVVEAERLLRDVWGEQDDPRPEQVRTAVARLRRRLSDGLGAPLLTTVRGHGYRLEA